MIRFWLDFEPPNKSLAKSNPKQELINPREILVEILEILEILVEILEILEILVELGLPS